MKLLILEQHREPENTVFRTVGIRHGTHVEVVDPVALDLRANRTVLYRGTSLVQQFDAVVLRSYRRFSVIREVARSFADAGKPVFGLDVEHPAFCQDKLSDLLDLQRAKVAVPATWTRPPIGQHEEVVMKENWGYGGQGVSKVRCDQLTGTDPYGVHFQEFLSAPNDWRVLVCEGKALPLIVVRTPEEGDFRTNTHQGGVPVVRAAHEIEIAASLIRLAESAAQELGRPCAGVDLRQGPAGPVVLEVNRTPRLRLGNWTEYAVECYLLAWKKAST